MQKTKKEADAEYFQKIKKERPWLVSYKNAHDRCKYECVNCFHRYGGRGIKFLMTKEEVRNLWFRDGAEKMKKPSLDRIDNDGNYTFENCRFIEKSENTKRKPVYRPPTSASNYLGVCRGRYGKWLAQLQVNKKRYWLGEFKTEIEAHEAYKKAKAKFIK